MVGRHSMMVRRGLMSCATIAILIVGAVGFLEPTPARAQDGTPHPPGLMPPQYSAVDANGVDLINGSYHLTELANSIGGQGAQGLSNSNLYMTGGNRSSMNAYFQLSDDGIDILTNTVLMGQSMTFEGQPSAGGLPVGDTLGHFSFPNSVSTYTGPDGLLATFQTKKWNSSNPTPIGLATSVTYPSGEKLTFTYGTSGWQKIESSLGYALVGYGGGAFSTFHPVTANLKNGSCDTTQCSGTTYAEQADQGRALQYTSGGANIVTYRNPSGDKSRTYTSQYLFYSYRVTSFSDGVSTWTYSYAFAQDATVLVDGHNDGVLTVTATDPLGHKRVVVSRMSNGHIISDTDKENHTTSYVYEGALGFGRIQQVFMPEGDRFYYEMDDYRNVTAKWHIPKGASTTLPADQIPGATVARAGYSCRPTFAGGQNCVSPDWTRDERGNQTDYAYDTTMGELLSVTQSAGPNGKRPQTRYNYGSFTARYMQNGAWVTGAPVRRLVQTSTCQTLGPAVGTTPAPCVGTADETVVTYAYEPSDQPNNVRLLSTTTRSGDGTLVATTTYAYDDRGDVIAVDGPLPGTADTTRTYYDASRWKTGEIGPDPDGPNVGGTGGLLYRASRTTYDADGRVTLVETGTATDQSATGMDTFLPKAFTRRSYDPVTGLLVKTEEGRP
jgi:hypothetical protein